MVSRIEVKGVIRVRIREQEFELSIPEARLLAHSILEELKIGRPRRRFKEIYPRVKEMLEKGITWDRIAKELHVSKVTIRKVKERMEEAKIGSNK